MRGGRVWLVGDGWLWEWAAAVAGRWGGGFSGRGVRGGWVDSCGSGRRRGKLLRGCVIVDGCFGGTFADRVDMMILVCDRV